jgi:hypothetical protein
VTAFIDDIISGIADLDNNSRDRVSRIVGVARGINDDARARRFGENCDEFADGVTFAAVNTVLSVHGETSDLDTVANDLIQRLVSAWTLLGLPIAVLGSSAAAIGLQISCAEEGPQETAEGLQRIADEIMASVETTPRHLI